MNKLSISAIISNDIKRNDDDENIFELINVNDKIQVDNDIRAKFYLIIIVNGYVEEESEINISIVHEEINRQLNLECINIDKDKSNSYVNLRYIYEIDIKFPSIGKYIINASLNNNGINEYYLSNFLLYQDEKR